MSLSLIILRLCSSQKKPTSTLGLVWFWSATVCFLCYTRANLTRTHSLKPIPNGYKYPCLQRDSNPQSTVPNGKAYNSAIARLLQHLNTICIQLVNCYKNDMKMQKFSCHRYRFNRLLNVLTCNATLHLNHIIKLFL